MNKTKVQQILQLENQAQGIIKTASERAKKIVSDAKAEIQKQDEESIRTGEQETKKIQEKAISEANIEVIQQQSKRKVAEKEVLAKKNFDKAVDFVLAQLVVQD